VVEHRIEVSSLFVTRCFATLSIPRWYAEEGASISIKRLQVTANSVRSCLAPAARRT
jgi:IS4 transposase